MRCQVFAPVSHAGSLSEGFKGMEQYFDPVVGIKIRLKR
jgi:hypothetical protein